MENNGVKGIAQDREDSGAELLRGFDKLNEVELGDYMNLWKAFSREVEWNVKGIDLYRRGSKEGRYLVRMLCMRIKEFLMRARRVSGVVGEELGIEQMYEAFSKRNGPVVGSFEAVCINWDYTGFESYAGVSVSLERLYRHYTIEKGASIVLVKRRGRLLVMGLDLDTLEQHRFCQDVLRDCNGERKEMDWISEVLEESKEMYPENASDHNVGDMEKAAETNVNEEKAEVNGEDKGKPANGPDRADARQQIKEELNNMYGKIMGENEKLTKENEELRNEANRLMVENRKLEQQKESLQVENVRLFSFHETVEKQVKDTKKLQNKVFEDIKEFRQILNELNQGVGGFEQLPFKVAPIPGEDRIRLYNFKWPFKIDISQDIDGLIITAVRKKNP